MTWTAGTVFVGSAQVFSSNRASSSAGPDRYLAIPGHESEEAAALGRLDAYWNDRVTYPTGRFNPQWLRRAATQDEHVQRGIPEGRARVLPSSENEAAYRALRANYTSGQRLYESGLDRLPIEIVYVEVTPASSPADPSIEEAG